MRVKQRGFVPPARRLRAIGGAYDQVQLSALGWRLRPGSKGQIDFVPAFGGVGVSA